MKRINYLCCLLLTGIVAVGSSCGGGSTISTGNTNANANSSAAKVGRQPKADSYRYSTAKLLDTATQVPDFDAGMKGREVVVTGSVDRVSNDMVYFDGGSDRKIYCTIDPANSGRFDAVNKRVNDKDRYSKPVVEAVGDFKYTYTPLDQPMTITLENCSVLSFKEPD